MENLCNVVSVHRTIPKVIPRYDFGVSGHTRQRFWAMSENTCFPIVSPSSPIFGGLERVLPIFGSENGGNPWVFSGRKM